MNHSRRLWRGPQDRCNANPFSRIYMQTYIPCLFHLYFKHILYIWWPLGQKVPPQILFQITASNGLGKPRPEGRQQLGLRVVFTLRFRLVTPALSWVTRQEQKGLLASGWMKGCMASRFEWLYTQSSLFWERGWMDALGLKEYPGGGRGGAKVDHL